MMMAVGLLAAVAVAPDRWYPLLQTKRVETFWSLLCYEYQTRREGVPPFDYLTC
jgi:hypothetical protein